MSLAVAVGVGTLVVNVLALLAVVWWGGILVGRMTHTIEILTGEVQSLRGARHEHATALAALQEAIESQVRDLGRLTFNLNAHLQAGR
jgi:hypothetical protein